MKTLHTLLLLPLLLLFFACEDDNSSIGSIITDGEVSIAVDTFYLDLDARAVKIETFDSKTGNLMVGNYLNPLYGRLNCSFVTRLMCTPTLDVADSLLNPERVDSCKLLLAAERTDITGDSLAPQILSVYRLNKQLPSDINNSFNPEGFYDPSQLFASKSFTLSELSSTDSVFYYQNYVNLSTPLPVSFGKEVFQAYIDSPETFAWPQNMAENFLPGLYFETSFGKGAVANISTLYVGIFYHSLYDATTVTEEGDTIVTQEHLNHVTYPFTVSPEVLSSNNISYEPSENIISRNASSDDGVVVTTPGGYIANFDFPADLFIERYKEHNIHLSTVNDLILYIPAEEPDAESGLSLAENLLLVKSSEYEGFFNENRVPDSLTAFTGVYDATNGRYFFASMREYFIDLLSKPSISPEDIEFTIVPVEIETETQSTIYGTGATYVTKCKPYTARPTVTLLRTDQAMATFSFSTQMID